MTKKAITKNYLILAVVVVCIQSCAKSPTNPDENEIIKPQILYCSESFEPVHKRSLVLIDANGNNRKEVFFVTNGSIWYPSFSPDGNRILFAMNENNKEALYTIDVSGQNLTGMSGVYTDGHFPFISPQFMPDGISILYLTRIAPEDWELRILNSNNQDDRLLAKGYFYGLAPEITDDGQWIVVWDNGSLYRVSSQSGDRHLIASNNVFGEPFQLNQKTKEIVFRSYDPSNPVDSRLGKVSWDGSSYQKFSFSGQFARISEDATHILYVAMHQDKPSIWIANSNGSSPRVVASNWTWDEYVQFYPSGDRILFVRIETDRALFSCGLQGENLRQLTPFDSYGDSPRFCP
jgi:Tol biopolymer transport system component